MIRGPGFETARAKSAAQAAPAGGARPRGRGRGCGLFLVLFMFVFPAVAQTAIAVPSGQPVTLSEVLVDDATGEIWARFRFVAPDIARDRGLVDYDTAAGDIDHLCQNLAIPYLDLHGLSVARIVISLSDRALEFGASDPDATQFFEAFRQEYGRCIWEEF